MQELVNDASMAGEGEGARAGKRLDVVHPKLTLETCAFC